MKIKIKGLDNAQKQTERIQRGIESLKRYKGYVGSNVPYAYGAEHGRHKRGKLARRDGGQHYLQRATNEARNLPLENKRATAPGKWVFWRMGGAVRKRARRYAPRRKGKLRRSLKVKVRFK
jgi:hypothetical protein